jgi:hypothetical protein
VCCVVVGRRASVGSIVGFMDIKLGEGDEWRGKEVSELFVCEFAFGQVE